MSDQKNNSISKNSPVSVLFVDDEEDIRFSFEDRFENRFSLRLAASGVEGINILKDQPEIGVVVTDIRMPEMNGFELIRQARELNPDLGFIVVSGHGDAEDILQAMRLGARNYLRKPYKFSELENAVEQEIRRYLILRNERFNKEEDQAVENLVTSVDKITYELPSQMDMVVPVAFRLVRRLQSIGICNDYERGNIALALIEILTNALEHGNFEIPGEEKIQLKSEGETVYQDELKRRAALSPYKDRLVKIQVSMEPEQARFLVIDEGKGFDFENLPDPTDPMNLFLSSGRGIMLARAFLDEVEYQGSGNTVLLVINKSSD